MWVIGGHGVLILLDCIFLSPPFEKGFYLSKTCYSDALFISLNASVAGSCPPADDLCPLDATDVVKLVRLRSSSHAEK